MKYNYLKVGLATPPIVVGAPDKNLLEIKRIIKSANKQKVEIVVFGQNALTGYTLGSMAKYRQVLDGAVEALGELVKFSSSVASTIIIGLPLNVCNEVVDAAAVVAGGKLLKVISASDNHIGLEFVELFGENREICYDTVIKDTTFGFNFSVVFGEDFDTLIPNSQDRVDEGADVIFNLSASPALIDSFEERKQKIACLSKRLTCGYVYVSTGIGESVSQNVYSGDKIVSEAGFLIASEEGDKEEIIFAELDVDAVKRKKVIQSRHTNTYVADGTIAIKNQNAEITRKPLRLPFVPANAEFERIFDILGRGIYTRMKESGSDKVILGLSGGLDSAIVLLVAHRAFVKYGLPLDKIICVEMPANTSSSRTKNNAAKMIERLGVKGMVIPIQAAVDAHLKAIGHDSTTDIVYENAQARERTKILLDLANKMGALMLGTGDLSEVALGWSTFGGDQLAQYNPNSSLTKTLIRAMTRNYCLTTKDTELARVLNDVLATPISPELLANQDTEKTIGPYEVHDFFLYNLIGKGLAVEKTYNLACIAFFDYKPKDILEYLRIFITRFFTNQFKRTASCDGIQLHPYDLTGMVINSEFNAEQFLKEVDKLGNKD